MTATLRRLLIIAEFFLLLAADSWAGDLATIKQQFSQGASVMGTRHEWDIPQLSPAEEQTVAKLQGLADEIMTREDHATVMLAMLDQYKDQDNYARQALMHAVLCTHDEYLAADVPFLKGVFIASLNFHYDKDYPIRLGRWYEGHRIRSRMANYLLAATGQGDLTGDRECSILLFDNPTAWLNKYVP